MIRVRMGIKNGIELAHFFPQTLHPEIGAGIDHPTRFRRRDMNGTSRAMIARIRRLADRAVATNHGDPLRSAGA